MTELISIVVPVYGAENYIEETIQTVLHQTYENWELLLVDDCSKDASVDRIKPFLSDERIRLIKQETNQGQQLQEIVVFWRQRGVFSHFWMRMMSGSQISFWNSTII